LAEHQENEIALEAADEIKEKGRCQGTRVDGRCAEGGEYVFEDPTWSHWPGPGPARAISFPPDGGVSIEANGPADVLFSGNPFFKCTPIPEHDYCAQTGR
jgi:hypothetical protein